MISEIKEKSGKMTQFEEGGNKTTNTKNPKSPSSSIFDRFKGIVEEKEKLKNPIVNKNNNVEKLKEVFKEYLVNWPNATSLLVTVYRGNLYNKALELIKEKRIKCTSEDIKEFSLELGAFEDHKEFEDRAGLFLSALINSSGDKEFVVHTRHLKKKINYLGCETTKNIVIEGDVGECVGEGIKKGGSITVNGDAGDWVGVGMRIGSKIYLNGNYETIGYFVKPGGKIYHKGKLIIDGEDG
jgi:hypothetical protein